MKYNTELCKIVNIPHILFGEDDMVEVVTLRTGDGFMACMDELVEVPSVEDLMQLEDDKEDEFFDDDDFDDEDDDFEEEEDFDDDFLDDDDDFDDDIPPHRRHDPDDMQCEEL